MTENKMIINNQTITIRYTGDFREKGVPDKIYGILIDNGLSPTVVSDLYLVSIGEGVVEYLFNPSKEIPEKSELLKILGDVKIKNLEVEKN